MKKSVLDAALPSPKWQPKYPFDVVIAYEDDLTRHRAMHLHDHLARQLSDDFDFQCAWWKFGHIADPTLREQAVDDATAANMIVLSLHDENELNPAAQMWMEDWTCRREHHKCALVTLFPDSEMRRAPVFARLKQIARQARMDFFTNISEAAGNFAELNVSQFVQQSAGRHTPSEAPLTAASLMPRWGINES
ncbi:MAG: hypothetical protein QOF48_2861 [Verrucomicrobiota bacterium]|jgi:hypothetical protein